MRLHTALLLQALLLTALVTTATAGMAPFDPDKAPAAPDYANASSWVIQPDTAGEFPVDVFWAYPTILMDDKNWLMDPASPELLKAANGTLRKQASVFKGQANLYAPLYRQMNMAALSLSEAEQAKLISYGMDDVWRAFSYYIENLNQGRPFILAGHSQGSDLLMELALKRWGTLGVEKRLVAAYLIGWSITPDERKTNPALSICESATQTNCFIVYNTMEDGRQDAAPTRKPGSIVVNPLTWSTSDEFAPASLNIGAKFFNDDGTVTTVPHFTSAQVKDAGLVVVPINRTLVACDIPTFPKGVYHMFDYSLFYENLQQNVKDRINAFLGKSE